MNVGSWSLFLFSSWDGLVNGWEEEVSPLRSIDPEQVGSCGFWLEEQFDVGVEHQSSRCTQSHACWRLSFLVVFLIFRHNGDHWHINFLLPTVSSMRHWGSGSRTMFRQRQTYCVLDRRAWVFQRSVISFFSHFFSPELTIGFLVVLQVPLDLISKIYIMALDVSQLGAALQ